MAGWLADRTPYVSLAGAGLVLAAILGGHTIFAGPGHSSTGPANVPAVAASSAPPTWTASSSPASEASTAAAQDFPEEAVYTGRTGRIAVAVAVSGNRAVAYLCDGRRIEAWLSGRIQDGELRVDGKRARLEGRLTGDGLVGEFEVRGRTYDYQVEQADRPAGLYRSETDDGNTVLGWIVLPDGGQVGLRNDGDLLRPAPELTPGVPVRVNGDVVPTEEVSGDDRV